MVSSIVKRSLTTIIALLFIFICAFFFHRVTDRNTKVTVGTPAPVIVKMSKVKKIRWPVLVKTTGIINGIQAVLLRAEYEGRVTDILTQPSVNVKKGDLLVKINPAGLTSKLKSDIETFNLAKTHLDELTPLMKKGVIPKWQFQQGQKTFMVTKALVKQTKEQLELSNLKAPFPGKIGIYQVEIGDYVKSGAPLVTLQNLSKLRVDFNVPAKYATLLKKGQAVQLRDNFNQVMAKAFIIGIESTIEDDSQSIHVRASVTAASFTPGLFNHVAVVLNTNIFVKTVPQTAIVYTSEGNYVYVVEHDKAREVAVKIGEIRNGLIQIISGLNEGQTIISVGAQKVNNGTLVKAKQG